MLSKTEKLQADFADLVDQLEAGSEQLASSTLVEINNLSQGLEAGLHSLTSQIDNSYETLPDQRRIFTPELEALRQLERDNELNSDSLLGKVTLSESGHVIKATLEDLRLKNIKALAAFTSLTELYLHNNQITDLAPLSKLTSLTTLSLDSNQITDLTPLKNLSGLTELWLDDNQITDLTPLADLASLTLVGLEDNQISDLSPIKDIANFACLSIRLNPLSKSSKQLIETLKARGVEVTE